jgi:hypothetical protein
MLVEEPMGGCCPFPDEIAELMMSTSPRKVEFETTHHTPKSLSTGQAKEDHQLEDDILKVNSIDLRSTIDFISKQIMGEETRDDQAERTDSPQSEEKKKEHEPNPTATMASQVQPSESKTTKRKKIIIGKSDRNILENPTDLYVLIQNKKWSESVRYLESHLKEAGTWTYRTDAKGRLVWRLLPIHASIILEAPDKVIESLLAAYPHGAQSPDDQGMLPIHLAFRAGLSEKIVTLFLEAYPKSVEVEDFKGRLPLDLAQASSAPNREVFLRAMERGPSYFTNAELATARAAVIASVHEEQRATFTVKLKEANEAHQKEIELLQAQAAGKDRKQADAQEIENVRSEASKKQQKLMEDIASLEKATEAYQQEIESIHTDVTRKEGLSKDAEKAHQQKIETIQIEALRTQQQLKDKIAWLEIDLDTTREEASTRDMQEIGRIRTDAANEKKKFEAAMAEQLKAFNAKLRDVEETEAKAGRIAELETNLKGLEEAHIREIESLKSEASAKEKELMDEIVSTKFEAAKKGDQANAENTRLRTQLQKLLASEKDSTEALSETLDILEMQEKEWARINEELAREIKDTESTSASTKAYNAILTDQLQKKTAELQQTTMQFEEREKELDDRNLDLVSKVKSTEIELATERAQNVQLIADLQKKSDEEIALIRRVVAEKALNKNLSSLLSKEAEVGKEVESLSSQVELLAKDLADAKSELQKKDEEEKLVQSKLEEMLGTEDNMNEQIHILDSKLNEVKAEGKATEIYMKRQMESLQSDKDALQGTIMVLTKSMNQQQDDMSSRAGSRTGSSTGESAPMLNKNKKWEMLEEDEMTIGNA